MFNSFNSNCFRQSSNKKLELGLFLLRLYVYELNRKKCELFLANWSYFASSEAKNLAMRIPAKKESCIFCEPSSIQRAEMS